MFKFREEGFVCWDGGAKGGIIRGELIREGIGGAEDISVLGRVISHGIDSRSNGNVFGHPAGGVGFLGWEKRSRYITLRT